MLSRINHSTKKRVTPAIYLLVLFWLLASYLGMRRSLRWWYQRQLAQRDCEAEYIREGLLQEMFALRRSLELTLLDDRAHDDRAHMKEVQHWLTQIETIQHSLEAVMHRLAPPYSADSLPLAIQLLLKEWQAAHPTVKLELDLPIEWDEELVEQRRIVLATLSEWLRIAVSQPLPEALIYARLSQQAQLREFMIQLTTLNGFSHSSEASIAELSHLQQSFQTLAAGKCYCHKRGSTLIWSCQWRSP